MSNKSRYIGDSSVDCTCNILDKDEAINHYVNTMLARTNQMFEYTGLPDTIPPEMLELFLQTNGDICITEVDGNLYALYGKPGGAPDPYFRRTHYVVANPALNISKTLRIVNHLPPFGKFTYDGDCVYIKNDTNATGLMYMFKRYATQQTENDISIRCAQINARHQVFIAAQTDSELESANEYIKSVEAGKLVAVGEKAFLDGIKTANLSVQSSNTIIQLIELQQYLKASWFNEIGLNANFNMKREYLSEEELRSSTDVLLPLIDDMLTCREKAMDWVNRTYGTSISVKKNSAWEQKQMELDTAQQLADAEVKEKGGDALDS